MKKLFHHLLLATALCMCSYARVSAQCTPPVAFAVTGGGVYCSGGAGVLVGVEASQAGVKYQLKLDQNNAGNAIAGDGNAISFGLQKSTGTYTVVATDTITFCTATMSGSAIVSTVNCDASISDPCVCKNNATTLSNGQFDETITVNAPSNQVWSVVTATGLFAVGSPAPPAAPTPIPAGTLLTNLGTGVFELKGIHVDAIGYTVTVTNGAGQTLSIGNTCSYPNPSITAPLSADYCLFSDPVTLAGNPGDANIVSQSFTVNGLPATQFDPSQGIGQYVIEYTVDGGLPKASGATDPGCIQKVSTILHVIATPGVVNCNDLIYVTLGANCTGEVLPDDILEGTYGCYDDYTVELDKSVPLGNGPWLPPTLTVDDIGKTYQVRVTHQGSGNNCWGSVVIQDNVAPTLVCKDLNLACPVTNYTPAYLNGVLGITDAFPVITDCSNFMSSFVDTWVDLPCGAGFNGVPDLSGYVRRKWTAIDQWGNSSTCTQYLYLKRLHVGDVKLPADYNVSCGANVSTDPTVTGAPYFEVLGKKWPIDPTSGVCELQTTYADQLLPGCNGTYHILRTWTIYDFCLPVSITPPNLNPLYHLQVIAVMDQTGPVFTCPPNTTVSVDPFACCATVDLPDRIIEDGCSQVNSIGGMVTTFDPATGAQTGMYTFGGVLADFPGNNWWDRDTLGQWGFTPCLPIGTQTVVYTAQDDCGNVSSCSFKLTVADLMPPVAACDQLTQVSLGPNGTAVIDAATFDDGSYDICCLSGFKAGRSATSVGSTVSFNCHDVGKTIMVFFRATDCSGNTNDCMVEVLVDDKIKPVCTAPANVTVSCEQFDPSLALYGNATVTDNCCVDSTSQAVSYALFDTLCNKGTIVRLFKAFDCNGNSSQCTQRIVVNYAQNYYLKLPNDVIVTVCDGTGNYGEPLFFGEDCELLGVTYTDDIFTIVPDACFKIERNWKIINWCTYNPNATPLCINIPNPNPNPLSTAAANLPGPTVSACGTLPPWAPTVVKINPTDPVATNFCTFWDANANCYTYKQIIKIVDGIAPTVVGGCPASPDTVCDVTANDAQLWNEMYWWENGNQSHDLCEAPADLCISATDACSGANINIEYQLFLDLDNDGTMETIVNSINTGIAGLGWNNILFGNASGAGTSRQFDERAVALNQKYGFAIQETITGNNKTACVRFNTQAAQNNFEPVQLPHGTHKIKWFISDGCGNESVCEYTIIVRDCKAPTVVCFNNLSVNIMPTGMIQMWAADFLQYAEDNCTLTPFLQYSIRKCGQGSGFPLDGNGQPISNVTFTCDETGLQCIELWAIDLAGNADYCSTFVEIQDNGGNCSPAGTVTVSGALKTEPAGGSQGIEAATVEMFVQEPLTGNYLLNDLTGDNGLYTFGNVVLGADLFITPIKDDNPLNGVTTYDLVLMSKHILGLVPLSSPYKMIAADANKSNSITTFDIVEIRKLILGIYQEFPSNTSWRFIDKNFVFADTLNPFQFPIPEHISYTNVQAPLSDLDFIGIKIGDVNNTVIANSLLVSEDRSAGTLMIDVDERTVKAGDVFEVKFQAALPDDASQVEIQAFQMTLNLDGLEVSELPGGDHVTANNFGVFNDLPGGKKALTVSIDAADDFTVRFRATKSGKLSDMLRVSSQITKAEGYGVRSAEWGVRNGPARTNVHSDGEYARPDEYPFGRGVRSERMDVALRFNSAAGVSVSGVGFELYQNAPNPFVQKTSIGFHLPEATAATLTVYDETGRMVFTQKGNYPKGYNAITLDRALLSAGGILYYTLETPSDTATRKMVQTP